MIYQVWFDKKDESATAETARVLEGANTKLPLLQEPQDHYVLNDYDDKKGICINMILTSHNTPHQMNSAAKILGLPNEEAMQFKSQLCGVNLDPP